MARMLGPKSWDELTKLEENLSEKEKLEIKKLCRNDKLDELLTLVNKKITSSKKYGESVQLFNMEDKEALKNFFNSYKDAVVEWWVGEKFNRDMLNFLGNLDDKQLKQLQALKGNVPSNRLLYYPGWFLSSLGKGIANGLLFLLVNPVKYLMGKKGNYFDVGWPNYNENALGDLKNELNKGMTDLILTDDNIDDAMLLIPDAKKNNAAIPGMDMAKKMLLPDARKLQSNWQKALFVISFVAALVLLFAFPYVLVPILTAIPLVGASMATMVVATSILSVLSKLFFAWSLTKLPPFIIDLGARLVLASSDDNPSATVISEPAELNLKPEDQFSQGSSTQVIQRAVGSSMSSSVSGDEDHSMSSHIPVNPIHSGHDEDRNLIATRRRSPKK